MTAGVGLGHVTPDDEPVIDRLWQLYVHDLSHSRGSMPNAEGLFKQGHLAWYRAEPHNWSGYLLTYDGSPAGFAFVSRTWNGNKRTIGDFFVVRGVRRRGVGFEVARQLIARDPGRWEIAFQAENPGAPEFWRRVVSSMVGAAWTEELRPVPNKPDVPRDHWLVFDSGR